jgi:hypothetical protein
MRFAYCALHAVDVAQTLPHHESGGYWIARSSRAMAVPRGEVGKGPAWSGSQRVGTADAVASRRWANNAIVRA